MASASGLFTSWTSLAVTCVFLVTWSTLLSNSIGSCQDLSLPDDEIPTTINSSLYNLTTPELIQEAGYPVETYYVTTSDGYILTLFRIPFSPSPIGGTGAGSQNKPVVLIQHGLLASSSTWLINSPGKNLPYQLADLNYDVWLGNARGCFYSRNHTTLSPDESDFWNFSYHEMGVYDLPSVIDFILEKSGASSLGYIGHSMGTTQGYVLLSEKPEYNDKIKVMVSLAPVAFTTYMSSPIRILAPLLITGLTQQLLAQLSTSGKGEYSPNDYMKQQFRQWACSNAGAAYAICITPQFVQYGFDYPQVNISLVNYQSGHFPQGSSIYAVTHLAQGINSRKFAKYDYGLVKNLQKYGQATPPEYNLSQITAPVILIGGLNDWLADPTDVVTLSTSLPPTTLKGNYRVNYTAWNHGDFLTAKDVNLYLNQPLISLLSTYFP